MTWCTRDLERACVAALLRVHARPQDWAQSWQHVVTITPQPTAYSSLVPMPDGKAVGLLYSMSNEWLIVYQPDHILFTTVTLL